MAFEIFRVHEVLWIEGWELLILLNRFPFWSLRHESSTWRIEWLIVICQIVCMSHFQLLIWGNETLIRESRLVHRWFLAILTIKIKYLWISSTTLRRSFSDPWSHKKRSWYLNWLVFKLIRLFLHCRQSVSKLINKASPATEAINTNEKCKSCSQCYYLRVNLNRHRIVPLCELITPPIVDINLFWCLLNLKLNALLILFLLKLFRYFELKYFFLAVKFCFSFLLSFLDFALKSENSLLFINSQFFYLFEMLLLLLC